MRLFPKDKLHFHLLNLAAFLFILTRQTSAVSNGSDKSDNENNLSPGTGFAIAGLIVFLIFVVLELAKCAKKFCDSRPLERQPLMLG